MARSVTQYLLGIPVKNPYIGAVQKAQAIVDVCLNFRVTQRNMMFFTSLTTVLALCQAAFAASRTSPPSGAIVVRAGTTTTGEFKTVSSAVASLPNDSSSRSIFIYPGTYSEQVYITRAGPLTVRVGVNMHPVFGTDNIADLWLHN